MGRRTMVAGTVAVVAAMTATTVGGQPTRAPEPAQAIRWNALASARDTLDDAPVVTLRFEGTSVYSYGAPVRVWFTVDSDAYVIVARVDANGHLTLLYPSSRTASSAVEGGREQLIRGRRGAASFYATDRMGGGFVFAIASYDPFDLSRLGIRDFDRYVTGTYVGRPGRVYIGDPHRVITRFASMVTFGETSPYDYAVEYYQVDAPYYVSSVGFSNFCYGFGGQYRRGLQERWDDELFYGMGSGLGASANCGNISLYCGLGYYNSPWGYDLLGWGAGGPLCFYPRGPQANGGVPTTPPLPPASDSLRVPPWLPDSIRIGRPDTVGSIPERRIADVVDPIRRQTLFTTGPDRVPGGVDADDPSGRSYAIPERALRHNPTTFGERRDRGAEVSILPDRRNPSATGGPDITWVRPPREVAEGPRGGYGDGALPRSPRSGASRGEGDLRSNRPTFVNTRGDRDMPPRYEPPTRTFGPRFDTPPNVRNSLDQPRYDPLPPRYDGPRYNGGATYSPPLGSGSSNPGGTVHGGGVDRVGPSPAPATSSPAASPPPPASSGSAASGDKKPEKH